MSVPCVEAVRPVSFPVRRNGADLRLLAAATCFTSRPCLSAVCLSFACVFA